MSWCITPGFEVTSQTVTVQQDNGSAGKQTFRLTAPANKTPLSGGFNIPYTPGGDFPSLLGSYPDGNDWVFVFLGKSSGSYNVPVYLVSVADN